jgi:hypothetical protein
MQADQANATSLKNILDRYCAASRQLVSVANSSIIFNPNPGVAVREEVCTILDIMIEALINKYLGLPAIVGADHTDCKQFSVDKVCKRINGWLGIFLPIGGKEVLPKSIGQAIPAYAMLVFKIPKQTCKGITNAMSQYWWGDDGNRKKM